MGYLMVFSCFCFFLISLLKKPQIIYFPAYLKDNYGAIYKLYPHTRIGGGRGVDIRLNADDLNRSMKDWMGHMESLMEINYSNGFHYLRVMKPDQATVSVIRTGVGEQIADHQIELEEQDRIRITIEKINYSITYIYSKGVYD